MERGDLGFRRTSLLISRNMVFALVLICSIGLSNVTAAGKSLGVAADLNTSMDSDGDGLSDFTETRARFEVVPGSFSWTAAKADAEKRGGFLVTIESQAKWNLIQSQIGTALANRRLWIGATDQENEGSWRWIHDQPMVFRRWYPGEPNDSGREDYLSITPEGLWNDVSNDELYGYVLERPFSDPLKPDTDGDGYSDRDEVLARTDPSDPSSFPGLIAFFPFSGSAADSSSRQNDGSVHGTVLTTDRFGSPNSAYSFNGASSYIETTNSLAEGDSMSFSVWLTAPGAGTTRFLFFEGDATGGFDYALALNSGTGLEFSTKDDKSLGCNLNAQANQWVHIIGVADASTKQKQIWINGNLAATAPFSGSANIGHHHKLQIGRFADGAQANYYFKGKLDDLRFYNRALTPAEMNSLNGYLRIENSYAGTVPPLRSEVLVSFDPVPDRVYTVQFSTDFTSWTNLVAVSPFTSEEQSFSFSSEKPVRGFFRLMVK